MAYAARIQGTGSAFPQRRLTNDELARQMADGGVETSDQWIRERTGIRERRITDTGNSAETNSALGARAARKVLDMAGKSAGDIDQIIYVTCTPDT
jgi:3-oxoacyl-[acyl-carrier-protein] synthase-3